MTPTDHEFNDERPVAGAVDPDCCHEPRCAPGEHDRAMAAMAEQDEREAGRIAPITAAEFSRELRPGGPKHHPNAPIQVAGKSPIVQAAESITRTIERTNAILRDREAVPPMLISSPDGVAYIDPEPTPDVFQDRADADDTTRVEAKRRVLTEAYGGDPMLIDAEVCGCGRGSGAPHPLNMHGTMLDPGTGTAFPELAQDATDAPRSLRDILFSHRALAAATALEITELMADLTAYIQRGHFGTGHYEPQMIESYAVIRDARQQRDNARGQDQLFGSNITRVSDGAGAREAQWRDANPGLAALLEAVDRG